MREYVLGMGMGSTLDGRLGGRLEHHASYHPHNHIFRAPVDALHVDVLHTCVDAYVRLRLRVHLRPRVQYFHRVLLLIAPRGCGCWVWVGCIVVDCLAAEVRSPNIPTIPYLYNV